MSVPEHMKTPLIEAQQKRIAELVRMLQTRQDVLGSLREEKRKMKARAKKAEAELEHWKDCNLYPSTYRDAVEQNAKLRDELKEIANEPCACVVDNVGGKDYVCPACKATAALEQTKEAEDG